MIGGGETVLFWVLGSVSVLGALGLLFSRKTVHAAVSMAMVMISLGVFYIAQHAEFVGIIQIFVYSGAVMMLFLFVVMLVGVDASDSLVETIKGQKVGGFVLALGLAAVLIGAISRVAYPEPTGLALVTEQGGVSNLAHLIFGTYVWAFEVLGALLVIAVMGAMVLAHRERLTPRLTQKDLSQRKIRSNKNLSGLPAPGVYARHNAADTPALLPDGSPSELSVSRVLVARDQVSRPDAYETGAGDVEREIEEGSTQ